MKRSNLLLAAFVVGVISFGLANTSLVQDDQNARTNAVQSKGDSKAVFTCPMHAEVISDKHGECPQCGMDLVKKKIKSSSERKDAYTCPMHPEVTSEKPGECPKCGMDLVLSRGESKHNGRTSENSNANGKIGQARLLLTEAKKDLAQKGEYNCCIKEPCDRCALDHQSCQCAENVKSGKPVCPECYAGWQRGHGAVKGVKASSVKGNFHNHKH